MNRTILIAFAALLAIYLLWPKADPPPPSVPDEADRGAEVPTAEPTLPEVATPRPLASGPTPLPSPPPSFASPLPKASRASQAERARPPRPPPGGLSYFKYGELIVVMGDVLYGKPQNPGAPDTGFVRANPVDSWQDGVIPYFIEPSLPNPERVQKALTYMMERTPIRFVPFNGQPDAIVFQKGDKDCLSYLGRIGGHQPIKLDKNCDVGEILHELMHVLGFVHEQSRPDRDQFVQINWDQIQPENRSQFEIAPDEVTKLSLMTPFDYQSVMLYRPTTFVLSPGLKALESRTSTPITPVEDALSPGDLERIYKIYGR